MIWRLYDYLLRERVTHLAYGVYGLYSTHGRIVVVDEIGRCIVDGRYTAVLSLYKEVVQGKKFGKMI